MLNKSNKWYYYMRDFSIDLQTENITQQKTKDYFNEVVKSYYAESYRSVVVMLYSIAIADLLYKLEELKELYDDSSAIEILDVISDIQTKNPNSPDWETKLIELVKDKTNLLEPADFLNLNTLQKHRHLCAHPVLTQNFELYRPNKETARAHIRNILEGILTKPALLSRKIFDDFLESLAYIKSHIHDNQQLENYLKTKYLDKVNSKVTEHIFRSLWKITFKLSNDKCIENRDINFKALLIVIKNNYKDIIKTIESEKSYYGDLNVENLEIFISLLNKFPELFEKLEESVKILIKNLIEKNADLDAYAAFLSKDIETHIKKIEGMNLSYKGSYEKRYINNESIIAIFEIALNEGKSNLGYDFLITMFAKSDQYDTADSRFDFLILPYLNEFNKEQIIKIIEAINTNSQIHERRNASRTNSIIIERAKKLLEPNFDLSAYPNI